MIDPVLVVKVVGDLLQSLLPVIRCVHFDVCRKRSIA